MPRKVLGIDIGSYRLKMALASSSLRGFELIECRDRLIDRGAGCPPEDAGVEAALRELLSGEVPKADVYVATLPASRVIVRKLKLPFKSPREIRAVVKYEVEQFIPLAAEDIVVDFCISNPPGGKDDGVDVICVCAQKEDVARNIALLRSCGIDPHMLTVDFFASLNCVARAVKKGKECFSGILIHAGHCQTGIMAVEGGELRECRLIHLGGASVLRNLSGELGVSVDEALNLLSLSPSASRTKDEKFEEALKKSVLPLSQEIAVTLRSLRASEEEPAEAILSGGMADSPGFVNVLSRLTGMSILPLVQKSGITSGGKVRFLENNASAPAVGLAMGGLGLGDFMLNLRGDEFAVEGGRKALGGVFYTFIILLAAALLAGSADLYLSKHFKERRLAALKAEMRGIFKETFPDVRRVVSEVQQAKSRLEELKGRAKVLEIYENRRSVLDILLDMRRSIPEKAKVRITDLDLDQSAAFISGEADSFETVDKIKANLGSLPCFSDIRIVSAKMSNVAGTVEFKFKLTRSM